MKVYRLTKCKYIDDLTGWGASAYPGRWNSKGIRVLYTAQTISLAALESMAHLANMKLAVDFCQLCLGIPDKLITHINSGQLPDNWRDHPPPDTLKPIGDRFIKSGKYLAMQVPSVIVPDEYNFLLNPAHPQFSQVKILQQRTFTFDSRLLP